MIAPILLIALANIANYMIDEYQEKKDMTAILLSTRMYIDAYSTSYKASEENSSVLRIFARYSALF